MLNGEGVFLVNCVMDALCLWAAGKFMHVPIRRKRALLSGLLGGIYALFDLWWPFGGALLLAGARGVLMSICAFPMRGAVKGMGGMVLVGLCAGGATGLLFSHCGARTALASAGAVMASFALYGSRSGLKRGVMEITHGEKRVWVPVLMDTGNGLQDAFADRAVVVVQKRYLASLLILPEHVHMIAVQTAGGEAVLPCFVPDRCRVRWTGEKAKDVWVSVAWTDAPLPLGLFPPHGL